MTHSELVAAATKWLAVRHPLIITEMATTGEEPDALGFRSRSTTLVECKTSRSDFLADSKKLERRRPAMGKGNYRLYLCERCVILPEELPSAWGLLWVVGARMYVKKKPVWQTSNMRAEMQMLVSLARRLGYSQPEGVSIKFYTHRTRNRAGVSVDIQEG